MPLLHRANPSTTIISCCEQEGIQRAHCPGDACGLVTVRFRNLMAQPRGQQTAHELSTACCLFGKWSFIGTQPYPFVYTSFEIDFTPQQQSWVLVQRLFGPQSWIYLVYGFFFFFLTEKACKLLAPPIRPGFICRTLWSLPSIAALAPLSYRPAPWTKLLVLPGEPML